MPGVDWVREVILPDGERCPWPGSWGEPLALLLEGCGLAVEPAGPEALRLERSLAGLTVALRAGNEPSGELAAELGQRLAALGAACTVGEPPLEQELLLVVDVLPARSTSLRLIYGPLPFAWPRRVARRMATRLAEAGLPVEARWRPWRGGAKVAFRLEGSLAEGGGLELVRAVLRGLADTAPRPPADWARLGQGLARLAEAARQAAAAAEAGAWARAAEEGRRAETTGAGEEAAPEAVAAGEEGTMAGSSAAEPEPVAPPAPEDGASAEEKPRGDENLLRSRRARVSVGRARGDQPPPEAGRAVQVVRYRRPGG